jgi:hypothetical protein
VDRKTYIKMKNLLALIAVLFTAQLSAQTHEIVKHNGEKLDVNYIKMAKNIVYYALQNSMEEHRISRYAVAQLNEKAKNNSKIISEKINLTENLDYKKVIVLKESEVIGLTKSESIKGYHTIAKGETRWSLAQVGEKQLKQNAVKKRCPFIVITSNKKDNLKAIGYTY